jgi:hypothetical protein
VINDDPERELDFSYTGNEVGIELQTDASAVNVEVNDAENAVKVELVQKENEEENNKENPLKKICRGVFSFLKDVAKSFLVKAAVNALTTPDYIPSILS